MNKIKPKNQTKAKKLICDWTDKKNNLIRSRMLKFFVGIGMVVEKIHELVSFKQNKWLEKYITFIELKRSKSRNEFEKDFYN